MSMDFFITKIKQTVALSGAIFFSISLLCIPKISAATPGTISITEYMANPATVTDTNGEWIEVKNTSESTVSLNGWDVDGSTINGDVFIRPGHFAVICKNSNTATNDGVVCDATSGFSLSNTSDTISVRDETNTVIGSLNYNEGTVSEGHSNYADMSVEVAKKYSTNNFGTPAHNQTTPPVAPGEIRVHHAIDINNNKWPDFNAGEPHFKGRLVRLYKVTSSSWTLEGEVETTGKYYGASAKFIVDPGKYALCEVAVTGYTQSFSRTITGWYSAPEMGVTNQSAASDEYTKCIPVNVSSAVITSHVFGDSLAQTL